MKMNPNSINKLPSRERTELEKYVRFLVFKMSQVIVQSRFGEKRKAVPCSKLSFHDWFNLAIDDNSEIQIKAKEAYSNITPLKDFCISTEILLKTADGDTLVLETWSLRMTASDFYCDSPHISYISLASVYSRMALLLKSVIAVTRITPAFKLSSCQSADMYVILFRIYPGEPQVHQLGEHYQRNKIGEVLTPVGTIKMTVSYRSKDDMTITPQKVEKGSPFMMKSDYFKPDMKPKTLAAGGIRIDRNLNCQKSGNELGKVGAFAPSNSLPENNMFPDIAILEKSFLNLSIHKKQCPDVKERGDSNANLNLTNYAKGDAVDQNCNPSDADDGKSASSAGSAESGDFIVAINIMSCAVAYHGLPIGQPFVSGPKNIKQIWSSYYEKKPPFADCGRDNDLGAFFRECQSAPPLVSFISQPTLAQSLSDVENQISKFEQGMKEIDEFIDSFCNVDLEQ